MPSFPNPRIVVKNTRSRVSWTLGGSVAMFVIITLYALLPAANGGPGFTLLDAVAIGLGSAAVLALILWVYQGRLEGSLGSALDGLRPDPIIIEQDFIEGALRLRNVGAMPAKRVLYAEVQSLRNTEKGMWAVDYLSIDDPLSPEALARMSPSQARIFQALQAQLGSRPGAPAKGFFLVTPENAQRIQQAWDAWKERQKPLSAA